VTGSGRDLIRVASFWFLCCFVDRMLLFSRETSHETTRNACEVTPNRSPLQAPEYCCSLLIGSSIRTCEW